MENKLEGARELIREAERLVGIRDDCCACYAPGGWCLVDPFTEEYPPRCVQYGGGNPHCPDYRRSESIGEI